MMPSDAVAYPHPDTDVPPQLIELIRLMMPSALHQLMPGLFRFTCQDGDVLILEERARE